jgi:hypothetical protein
LVVNLFKNIHEEKECKVRKSIFITMAGIALLLVAMTLPAFADVADAPVVDITVSDCGETTFTAYFPNPPSNVANAELIVYANGETQSEIIPADGSSVEITVGPFYSIFKSTEVIIEWRVFGGGERDYDVPLWTGYEHPDFKVAINWFEETLEDSSCDEWAWTTAGPDECPNPFTKWNEETVTPCLWCKNGGWFDNWGL